MLCLCNCAYRVESVRGLGAITCKCCRGFGLADSLYISQLAVQGGREGGVWQMLPSVIPTCRQWVRGCVGLLYKLRILWYLIVCILYQLTEAGGGAWRGWLLGWMCKSVCVKDLRVYNLIVVRLIVIHKP